MGLNDDVEKGILGSEIDDNTLRKGLKPKLSPEGNPRCTEEKCLKVSKTTIYT